MDLYTDEEYDFDTFDDQLEGMFFKHSILFTIGVIIGLISIVIFTVGAIWFMHGGF